MRRSAAVSALLVTVMSCSRGNGAWNSAPASLSSSSGQKRKSNQLLSERRAEAVRARLVKAGVAEARLKAAGYGASRPKETNATIEGRARNRRVELARDCNPRSGT